MAKKATSSTKRTTKSKSTTASTAKAASPAKKSTTTTVSRSSAASTRPAWLVALTRKVPASNTSVGAVVAEFVGTFLFAGVVLAASGQPIIILFALAGIFLTISHLSGGHMNPAITIAAWVNRQITATRMGVYVVAQVLGAMLAYVVLNWLLKGTVDPSAAMLGQATELYHVAPLVENKEWYAFWAELLGAAVLGFGYASFLSGARRGYAAAYAVAGSMFVGLVLAGKTAILNPAVAVAVGGIDFGKAVLWPFTVWAIAAILGAALGMYLYRFSQRDVVVNDK